jgi:hypothetical protein
MMGPKLLGHALKSFAVAAVGGLALSVAAHADFVPDVTMQFFASNDGQGPLVYDLHQSSSSVTNGGSMWEFQGGMTNAKWVVNYTIEVNPGGGNTAGGGGGAFINLANLAVTNTTNTNQTFWIQVTMSVGQPLPNTVVSGDVTVSIQSYVGQGASLMNITSPHPFAGDPIFEGYNDATPTLALLQTTHPGLPVTSSGFGVASETEVGGPVAAGQVLSSISIWLKIEVTEKSIATVIGIYEVIPAPAALPILAMGIFAGRRRRRL